MGGLKQPSGQVRLTNVATVKLKKDGERFEIACYKNKILNWRSGVETDIQEVLQSPYIFTSISKGKMANHDQLKKAFNTTDINIICKKILDKGEIQVSKEEREQFLAATGKDVVTILTDIAINPSTGYPLTSTLIENTLKASGFSISLTEPAKKQALKALAHLQKLYPNEIARSQMRLRITCNIDQSTEVTEFLKQRDAYIEQDDTHPIANAENTKRHNNHQSGIKSILFLCCPKLYREVDAFVNEELNPPGTLQLVSLNVKDAGNKGLIRNNSNNSQEKHDDDADVSDDLSQELQIHVTITPTSAVHQPIEPRTPSDTRGNNFKCTQCALEVESATKYREHCKSDFHVHNSKRKLKGEPPLTMEEFTALEIYKSLTR